ncbi:MAG TPA: flagellar hook-associated protein FlgK [Methylomirabilota bacterium]|jgi:flagellar hook-associated protein 1 FlgK|nr:flagellar hook-associated protein FlgK [Methylomirabilota bacterium]
MSILSVLQIGAGAMLAQQQALQTTGHNIANVDTPGYARQRVNLAAAYPSPQGAYFLGLGVNPTGVTGIVDSFMEAQLVSLKTGLGFSEAEQRALSSVADALPVTEEQGIGPALEGFWNALSELANNPAGQAERANLIGRARTLGDMFRQTRAALVDVQNHLDKDLDAAVRRVNTILPQIAALNQKITEGEVGGQRANDFRDQRQMLLQELAQLTGATAHEESNGQLTVQVDGVLLVAGQTAAALDASQLNPTGFRMVKYVNPQGASYDATAILTKGEIGGLITARDATVAGFINRLDTVAKTLVDAVNAQHAQGFDVNGAAGGNFFAPIAATTGAAGVVQVDSAVLADPRLIAAAQDANSAPGDNRNARALASLRTSSQAALGGATFKDYFIRLISDVGQQVQTSQDTHAFQQALVDQMQQRRESLSGVNIDEEVSNLIKFQRAFQAASRLISVGDEMYETIVNILR